MSSRGDAISAYQPDFQKGARVYSANVKSAVISGTIANSGVVYGFSHGLSAVPAFVMISPKGTVGQLKAITTSANSVGLATVSAATSAKFFVAGAKNTYFNAYVLI